MFRAPKKTLGDLDAEADDIEALIIDDHNTALGCPFNEFPQFHDPNTVAQWPNTAGDINNFSSIILGSLTVDDGDETPGETLTLSFHIDSDDRALLRIVGQNFEDVTGQELWEIDGDEVYAMIQAYTSRPVTDAPRFEAHRKYLDIQYLVSGTEAMGWAPLDQLAVNVPYDDERDRALGTVPVRSRTLVLFSAGYAILLYPSDAHSPGLAAHEPEPVVKVVVKVLLDT